MIKYRLSKQGTDLLNDIKGGVNDIYNKAKNDKRLTKKLDKTYTGLESSIKLLFGCTSSDDNDKLLDGFISVFSKAVLLAYLQKFDNDRDLETLKSQYSYTDSEVKDRYFNDLKEQGIEITQEILDGGIPDDKKSEYEGAKIDTDFRFGFQGLAEVVTASVEILRSKVVNEKDVSDSLASNLLTVVRDDVTPEEYLTGGYMEKDIQLIALFGDPPLQNMYQEILNFIENDNNYYSIYTSALNSILGVYKYLLQDSFGLRPYVGVLSFRNLCCKVITKSYRLGRQQGSETVFKDMTSKLSRIYRVNEMTSRQFSVKQIVNSSSEVPMYFANKLLEYAMGRQLTYHLSEAVYRDYPNVNSWEAYEAEYVEPQLKSILIEAIYYSLEKNYTFKGIENPDDKVFDSKAFATQYASEGVSIREQLSSANMKSLVDADIQRVMRSLCSGGVVTKYNNLKGVVNSIAVRIVDVNGDLSLSNTRLLFDGCTASPNVEYSDGEVITEGRRGRDDTPIPYRVIEYQHDFNPTLSQAEPLFGYTAVDMFVARGRQISWSNILLGEDIKGTPIFANLGDPDAIPLQCNIVHNMIAGTRSGKGVMTMNILGSAIAEEKPVFYIDNKPDMAVLFADLSDMSMFVVNGHDYKAKNDAKGIFNDNGVAISGWKAGFENAPSYLRKSELMSKEATYTGGNKYADLIYFRAMLFTLSILAARVDLDGTEFYNSLGGDNGIVIVIDEFLNWQSNFENKMMGPADFFANAHRVSKQSRSEYEKLLDQLEELEIKMQSPNAKPEALATLPTKIARKKAQLSKTITPLDVYCTTFMDKYGDTAKHLSSLLQAGLKDKEGKRSDIFVIGQNIEYDGIRGALNGSGTYPQRDSGMFNYNDSTKNKSLMRGILNMLPHDWFMGRNVENPNYMGASTGGSGKKWINQRSYWGYCSGSMESLRSSAPDNTIYFKPYLVLNKSNEDDPKNPRKISVNGELVDDPDYTFVSQCRDRVNGASSGLWEKVRVKHLVTEEMREDALNGRDKHYGCLNPGIGFAGFASKIKQSNGKGEFSSSDLASSGNIANFVAQRLGYSNYREFLFDLSPRGLFSSKDIIDAIRNPATFDDLEERLPLFAEFNMLNADGDSEDTVPSFVESAEFGDGEELVGGEGNLYEEEDEEVFNPSPQTGGTATTDDGWSYVNNEEDDWEDEDDSNEIPESVIRQMCERIITEKAKQRNKVLSKELVNSFCDRIVNILKGGSF